MLFLKNFQVISTINEREILAEIERQASGTGTKKATNINGSSYAADNLSKPHGKAFGTLVS